MKKNERAKYLGIDIGRTWIKGTIVDDQFFNSDKVSKFKDFQIKKIKSTLQASATPNELVEVLKELIASYQVELGEINGISISTAGIINYPGTKILKAVAPLNVSKTNSWIGELAKQLQCSAVIINDTDAATM